MFCLSVGKPYKSKEQEMLNHFRRKLPDGASDLGFLLFCPRESQPGHPLTWRDPGISPQQHWSTPRTLHKQMAHLRHRKLRLQVWIKSLDTLRRQPTIFLLYMEMLISLTKEKYQNSIMIIAEMWEYKICNVINKLSINCKYLIRVGWVSRAQLKFSEKVTKVS